MTGTTLSFVMKTETSKDAMGNSIYAETTIQVEDCLIAPMVEPITAREQQAMQQDKDQVRIHLPKAFTGDVSNSDVQWDGRTFHLDSDGTAFMPENTPTRWNRYFRAEAVNG